MLLWTACGGPGDPAGRGETGEGDGAEPRPSILWVTLDTTRADVLGYDIFSSDAPGNGGGPASTPVLDGLAARGVRFDHAYTTAPLTLPSHASMLTGLLPAEHGVHGNGRRLGGEHPLAAERLSALGYRTAAFVSGFTLSSQFGLGRGFDHYDDRFAGDVAERRADSTTDRALAWLGRQGEGPLFLWVHYFDPHDPYEPPVGFDGGDRYLGEVAFMDRELGRLVSTFEARSGDVRILVVGDHGEGRGDHGEALHGNLLYQGVARVPMVAAGDGIEPGRVTHPVSVRGVSDTLLAWAGDAAAEDLLAARPGVVLGEAMKPFLHYGWQPQVFGVSGTTKVIRQGGVGSSELEIYDLAADPEETRDLAGTGVEVDRGLLRAVRDYPLPAAAAGPEAAPLDAEAQRKLASLGYAAAAGGGGQGIGSSGADAPPVDAPKAPDMTHLFAELDRGSGLFVAGRYAEAIPVFEGILEADPTNRAAALRLAVAHSVTGDGGRAQRWFGQARALAPGSVDVDHYLAMHLFRGGQLEAAGPLFESVLERQGTRRPALEALSRIREAEGRMGEAGDLLARALELGGGQAAERLRLGDLRMAVGETDAAIAAFEGARDEEGGPFPRHLELGVLYLAAQRLEEARESLDRVPEDHPGAAMALFKRAQVSVLLGEADREARVRRAWTRGDDTTRGLIAREALFQGIELRND
ncbi:MAG: sulfatase-like hydrolase/transferase [Acidobacteriota bacterium]